MKASAWWPDQVPNASIIGGSTQWRVGFRIGSLKMIETPNSQLVQPFCWAFEGPASGGCIALQRTLLIAKLQLMLWKGEASSHEAAETDYLANPLHTFLTALIATVLYDKGPQPCRFFLYTFAGQQKTLVQLAVHPSFDGHESWSNVCLSSIQATVLILAAVLVSGSPPLELLPTAVPTQQLSKGFYMMCIIERYHRRISKELDQKNKHNYHIDPYCIVLYCIVGMRIRTILDMRLVVGMGTQWAPELLRKNIWRKIDYSVTLTCLRTPCGTCRCGMTDHVDEHVEPVAPSAGNFKIYLLQ